MKGIRKPPVCPKDVVIDACIRLPAELICRQFGVAAPANLDKVAPVILMKYEFAIMMYDRVDRSVHFLCKLAEWPQLIEGLEAWRKACNMPRRVDDIGGPVLFTPSAYCHEVVDIAKSHDLQGLGWDVMTNRFRHYSL